MGDASGAARFLTGYFNLPLQPVSAGQLNSPFPSFQQSVVSGTSFSAFNDINSLPSRLRTLSLEGRNFSCLFYDPLYDCAVWSENLASRTGGHLSFLAWDWSKTNYYQPIVQVPGPNRQSVSWPELSWRTALFASQEPQAPPASSVPLFDETYFQTLHSGVQLKVAVLNNATDPDGVANVVQFLKLSNHSVHLLDEARNATSVSEFLSQMDALVVPNPELDDFAMNYQIDFSAEVKEAIRNFSVIQGGRVVVLGRRSALFLNELFGSNLTQYNPFSANNEPFFDNYYDTSTDLIFNFGLNFISHATSDTRFTGYYNINNLLPAMIPSTVIFPYTMMDLTDNLDYCAYYFTNWLNIDYCGVWSKRYGTKGGHITGLANTFFDIGVGFRSTYMHNEPWARVLNIALGGDPNTPPLTATPSPSMTSSPSVTTTPSESSSTSKSESPSITVSKSFGASDSPTMSPTATEIGRASCRERVYCVV